MQSAIGRRIFLINMFNDYTNPKYRDDNIVAKWSTPRAKSAILLWMMEGLQLYLTKRANKTLLTQDDIQQTASSFETTDYNINNFIKEYFEINSTYA